MAAKRRQLVLSLALLLALLSGPISCQSVQGDMIRRLKIAGSTTIEPAAQAAAKAFMMKFPDAEVTVRGGGSSIGVKGVAYGALHVGMASRSLTESEMAKWPNLTTTVIGRDGVSVIVNHALYEAGVKQLTLTQVAEIWRGEITNWREVGGPDLAIMAFDKALVHGTRATFGKIVLGGESELGAGTLRTLGENETIIATVSEHPGAVSILSTGWPTDEIAKVAIVDENGQAVAPTTENVASGRYPISRNLNLITDGPPKDLAADFIAFMLSSEGQAFVEAAGYSGVSQ